MTVDQTPRDPRSGVTPRGSRPRPTSSRDLERYAGLFAERATGLQASAMRDLMSVTDRPEIISLAGGLPDTSTFPTETFTGLMADVAAVSAAALQYGPTEGLLPARQAISSVMAAEGMAVDADDILVTTGGQQAIDLTCRSLLDPHDVVVAEAPTYPGAIAAFSGFQADLVQIEMDADGMRVDLLEETLDRLEREGRRPKFIYTIPSFQNPGGVSMALERRLQLVEIACRREILVVEDNPYGLLRFEGEPLPTLLSLDEGGYVVYLGTFSKILAPGLRLGWATGPRAVLGRMNVGKSASDLCSPSLSQSFVAAYFAKHDWRAYVDELVTLYRERRDVMLEALAEHLPAEARWTSPQGGLFIWVRLPDFLDTTDLLARALRENVAFVPGRAAYLDGRGGSEMRLNFSGVDAAGIREAVRRIGVVVREQMALYSSLGPASGPIGELPAGAASSADSVDAAEEASL